MLTWKFLELLAMSRYKTKLKMLLFNSTIKIKSYRYDHLGTS